MRRKTITRAVSGFLVLAGCGLSASAALHESDPEVEASRVTSVSGQALPPLIAPDASPRTPATLPPSASATVVPSVPTTPAAPTSASGTSSADPSTTTAGREVRTRQSTHGGVAAAPTPGATSEGAGAASSVPAVGAGRATAPGSSAGYSYVEDFQTDIAPGRWPANGSAPAAYPRFASYKDGTSGTYYPSKVLSVHDGVLDWNCHNSMAAAVLPFGYEGFQYGTYTVRMRTDNFPQYHIAFLLWPTTDQWTHELDGPEAETSDSYPYPAVLQSAAPAVAFAPAVKPVTPASWNDAAFHDYTWQWGPGFVSFLQDGMQVTKVTTNVPNQPMRPVLQVEFSNAFSGQQKPDPSITGHVYVDRVSYDPSYSMAVPRA